MALDIRAIKTAKTDTGKITINYEIFDTTDASKTLSSFPIEGKTRKEIADKLLVKFELEKTRHDQKQSLSELADHTIADAKAALVAKAAAIGGGT